LWFFGFAVFAAFAIVVGFVAIVVFAVVVRFVALPTVPGQEAVQHKLCIAQLPCGHLGDYGNIKIT